MLSILLQGRSSTASGADASPDRLIAEGTRPRVADATTAQERSAPIAGVTSADAATRSSDLLEGLIADLQSKELTSLQKSQIRRRLAGQRVQWSGFVRETTSFASGHGEVFLLIWTPASQINEFIPDALAATFAADQEIEINALRKDDLVVIEGTGGFTQQGLDAWAPKLENSRLLSVKAKR